MAMSLPIVGLAVAAAAVLVVTGTYQVDEGHVGVVYRGGRLLDLLAEPGFNFKIPFLEVSHQVQVTLQVDEVRDIPCGTEGGVTLVFDKIEVVNRLSAAHAIETIRNYSTTYDKPLIFDRVAHVVSEECSTSTLRQIFIEDFTTLDDRIAEALRSTLKVWAPGVEVIAVRASKPRVPAQVRANFELVEVEKTKLLIAQQAQRVVEVEAETEKLVAQISARKSADVANITLGKQLMEREAQRRLSAIDNEISTTRSRAVADAEHYRALKVADANKQRLTPQYLQLVQIQSLSNASKVYFGDKLPSMYVDRTTPSAIGGA